MAIHIKEVLKNIIKKEDELFIKNEKILNILKKILDKKILKDIQNIKIYRNTLYIFSLNASCLYELNLQKKQILEAIQKEFLKIKNVKFKLSNYG
ncbi:MAG: DciA family protein [Candidatus Omnitrophica bacterium]|nr:DciA family protein [Candidatus Omnitrophota bacterium]